jgi:hypothetical protein
MVFITLFNDVVAVLSRELAQFEAAGLRKIGHSMR